MYATLMTMTQLNNQSILTVIIVVDHGTRN